MNFCYEQGGVPVSVTNDDVISMTYSSLVLKNGIRVWTADYNLHTPAPNSTMLRCGYVTVTDFAHPHGDVIYGDCRALKFFICCKNKSESKCPDSELHVHRGTWYEAASCRINVSLGSHRPQDLVTGGEYWTYSVHKIDITWNSIGSDTDANVTGGDAPAQCGITSGSLTTTRPPQFINCTSLLLPAFCRFNRITYPISVTPTSLPVTSPSIHVTSSSPQVTSSTPQMTLSITIRTSPVVSISQSAGPSQPGTSVEQGPNWPGTWTVGAAYNRDTTISHFEPAVSEGHTLIIGLTTGAACVLVITILLMGFILRFRRRKSQSSLIHNDISMNNASEASAPRRGNNNIHNNTYGISAINHACPEYDDVPNDLYQNRQSGDGFADPNENNHTNSLKDKVDHKNSFQHLAAVVSLVYGKGQPGALSKATYNVPRPTEVKVDNTDVCEDINDEKYRFNEQYTGKGGEKCQRCSNNDSSPCKTSVELETEGYLVPRTLANNVTDTRMLENHTTDVTEHTLDEFLTDEEASCFDDFSSDESFEGELVLKDDVSCGETNASGLDDDLSHFNTYEDRMGCVSRWKGGPPHYNDGGERGNRVSGMSGWEYDRHHYNGDGEHGHRMTGMSRCEGDTPHYHYNAYEDIDGEGGDSDTSITAPCGSNRPVGDGGARYSSTH
ncbi:hypothetical protein MAR_015803 [Mya arenaria]|uniref:Uncharacterized protein n=1 Tax=Mya arenaria TaxID=6604 RepID=A0ABY7FLU4_MYAAR|nr:hypothetical protein MAR_015803 [Mya arenaria]